MSSKSETKLQREMIDALESLGIWVIRLQVKGNSGPRSCPTGEVGMPDLMLPGRGHVEVKCPGEDLSPGQVKWHKRAKEEGVNCGTAWTIADCIKLARKWEK